MVSAIILAAGESKRMDNKNKLLLPFGDKLLIQHVVDNVIKSNVDEIIVVTGFDTENVKKALKNRNVKFIENKRFHEGMTTSIHAGVENSNPNTDAFMVCLSDLPFIENTEYNYIIKTFKNALKVNHKQIVVPIFNGQRGNPVIFSSEYKSEILMHKGKGGCKGVVKHNPQHVLEVTMPNNHILNDIDTQNDYNKLKAEIY